QDRLRNLVCPLLLPARAATHAGANPHRHPGAGAADRGLAGATKWSIVFPPGSDRLSHLPSLEVPLRTGVRVRDMENLKRKQVMSHRQFCTNG
ncbi:hypothetical protein, partial [Nitrosomonas sp.]|uniref:hypothetical protein n=1 Tax=Nitrosomonas sp. TaxID=42353 RepID=UPI00273085E3